MLNAFDHDAFGPINTMMRNDPGPYDPVAERAIRIMISVLNKMPVYRGTAYRVIAVPSNELSDFLAQYRKPNAEVRWDAFSSAAESRNSSFFDYMKGSDTQSLVYFEIAAKEARDIRAYKALETLEGYDSEEEVVFYPFSWRL